MSNKIAELLKKAQTNPIVIAAKEREIEEQQALEDYTRKIRRQLHEANAPSHSQH